MGGMHGFGPVPIEPEGAVFHSAWEGRVHGMQSRLRRHGWMNVNELRNAIERIPAARYLDSGYYARWLTAVESLMVAKGVVTREELATGRAVVPAPEPPPAPLDDRPQLRPRFQPGDVVVTRNSHPAGHTRIPRYVRGRRGRVRSAHGPFLLPDTNACEAGRDWEPVYAVEFSARDLWGDDGRAGDVICVDLWESYLKREDEA